MWLQLDLGVIGRKVFVLPIDLHLASNPDGVLGCVADDKILADGVVVDEWELFRMSSQFYFLQYGDQVR